MRFGKVLMGEYQLERDKATNTKRTNLSVESDCLLPGYGATLTNVACAVLRNGGCSANITAMSVTSAIEEAYKCKKRLHEG